METMLLEQLSYSEKMVILRRRHKKRAADVISDVCVSHSAYSSFEAGKRTPSLPAALRIARYFGVTVEYLFGDLADANDKEEQDG